MFDPTIINNYELLNVINIVNFKGDDITFKFARLLKITNNKYDKKNNNRYNLSYINNSYYYLLFCIFKIELKI